MNLDINTVDRFFKQSFSCILFSQENG